MKDRIILPGKILLMALFVSAIVAGTNLWHSSADNDSQDGRGQFVARLRDGLGDVSFSTPSSSPGKVRSSVKSVAGFMKRRSGLTLSHASESRLSELEERAVGGNARRLSASDLSTILTQAVYERIASLTDQEIEQAVEATRGFDAPDLPDAYKGGRSNIKIRASWGGPKVTESLTTQVRHFRSQAQSGDVTLKLLLGNFVSKEVESRARLLNEALPSEFIQRGALQSSSTVELTPAQAFLIAYSVVSDDPLLDSEANLHKQLHRVRAARAKHAGHYPSPEGHFAYGTNGYLYSSPLGLLLNEQTVNRLLQLVEEGGAK